MNLQGISRNFGYFGIFLGIFGYFWGFLGIYVILGIFRDFWGFLGIFGDFWGFIKIRFLEFNVKFQIKLKSMFFRVSSIANVGVNGQNL
jgi:hypothetical protein